LRDLDPFNDDPTSRRPVDAGNQVQQRALAGTARAHQRYKVAALDDERRAVERRDGLIALDERFSDGLDV
jgi:hypothetical protein